MFKHWKLDREAMVLRHEGSHPGERYEVYLGECLSLRQAHDWIAQAAEKGWVSDEVLGDLWRTLHALVGRWRGEEHITLEELRMRLAPSPSDEMIAQAMGTCGYCNQGMKADNGKFHSMSEDLDEYIEHTLSHKVWLMPGSTDEGQDWDESRFVEWS